MSSEREHLISKNRQSAASAYGSLIDNDDDSENLSNASTEYDPPIQGRTSNTVTMLHFLQDSIGPGILAMPQAFKESGLIAGLFGSIVLGIFYSYSVQMLVLSYRELCRRMKVSSMDFSDVCYYAFKVGPNRFQKFANFSRFLSNLVICINQIAICCIHIIIVATNMHTVIYKNVGYVSGVEIRTYIIILLIPFILLSFLKNLRNLTPILILAGILTIATIVIEFSYTLQDIPHINSVKAYTSWEYFALFFGTTIFALEGIVFILPAENHMRTPKDFTGWNGVLNTSVVLMTCLYIASGFYGYLKYNEKTEGIILLNFKPTDFLAEAAQWLTLIVILLSYSLQFYIPFEIIKPNVRAAIPRYDDCGIADIIFHCSFVLLTFIISFLMPNLIPVLAFVGAITSSVLSFIFLPIIHMMVYCSGDDRNGFGWLKWKLWLDIIILIIGILGSITGVYASVLYFFKHLV